MKKAKTRRSRPCVKNVLAIIAMFTCTNICLGEHTITINSALVPVIRNGKRVVPDVAGNSDKPNGTSNDAGIFPLDPNNNTLIIKEGARVGEASGARIDDGRTFASMTGNKIIVNGGDFNKKDINGACSSATRGDVDVNDNTVEINAGERIEDVFGGYTRNGTASDNKVFIKNELTIGGDVCGSYVFGNGNAEKNEVTTTSATVAGQVFGGYANGKGNAENNKVTIDGGKIGGYVCGGCVGGNGNAENNKVIINGGRIEGGVVGGFALNNRPLA